MFDAAPVLARSYKLRKVVMEKKEKRNRDEQRQKILSQGCKNS